MRSRQACRTGCQHGAGQAQGGRQRAAARLVAHCAAAHHLVAVLRKRFGHVVVQHDAVMHGVIRQRARHGLARAVHRKAVALRRAARASRAVADYAQSAAAAMHGAAALACSFRRSDLQLTPGEIVFRSSRFKMPKQNILPSCGTACICHLMGPLRRGAPCTERCAGRQPRAARTPSSR